ncbi:hypothetical protein MOV66_02550 [Agrobacterium sp. SHOUNA12C]|nr:hypothetical protein [Agrobacterium sp. BETTINA12B]MCJ9755513.1 hypothetical protein [Agrobacterium sp. SHOUNA12C]NTG34779.1 hypothetical protein [Rhizobium rhizogenes]NTG54028.1 hypothetical protein [Rhizobium rhizogenes]
MPAIYDGLQFKTALEAQWAAFFDLAGWTWKVNPVPVGDWSPDFRVTFPCGHSECGDAHTLLVTVLPVSDIAAFSDHPCLSSLYGMDREGKWIGADAGAAFGTSPAVTTWQMSHGAGGGIDDVYNWVDNADALWAKANSAVSKV